MQERRGCDIPRCIVGRVVVKKPALAYMQRVLLDQKELVQEQGDKDADERADQHIEDWAKDDADGVAY